MIYSCGLKPLHSNGLCLQEKIHSREKYVYKLVSGVVYMVSRAGSMQESWHLMSQAEGFAVADRPYGAPRELSVASSSESRWVSSYVTSEGCCRTDKSVQRSEGCWTMQFRRLPGRSQIWISPWIMMVGLSDEISRYSLQVSSPVRFWRFGTPISALDRSIPVQLARIFFKNFF